MGSRVTRAISSEQRLRVGCLSGEDSSIQGAQSGEPCASSEGQLDIPKLGEAQDDAGQPSYEPDAIGAWRKSLVAFFLCLGHPSVHLLTFTQLRHQVPGWSKTMTRGCPVPGKSNSTE